ncbi:MAG: bifunctional diguanylate cyclase/phosphodiesterase [Gammaproteobacteria bacterium]|nr:bifunctional diguanylate cyclase/phosphodiesterase [Gammaproteobacteria bacterium]
MELTSVDSIDIENCYTQPFSDDLCHAILNRHWWSNPRPTNCSSVELAAVVKAASNLFEFVVMSRAAQLLLARDDLPDVIKVWVSIEVYRYHHFLPHKFALEFKSKLRQITHPVQKEYADLAISITDELRLRLPTTGQNTFRAMLPYRKRIEKLYSTQYRRQHLIWKGQFLVGCLEVSEGINYQLDIIDRFVDQTMAEGFLPQAILILLSSAHYLTVRGEPARSVGLLAKARRFLRRLPNKNAFLSIFITGNLFEAYRALRKWERAQHYGEKTLALQIEVGAFHFLKGTATDVFEVMYRNRDYEEIECWTDRLRQYPEYDIEKDSLEMGRIETLLSEPLDDVADNAEYLKNKILRIRQFFNLELGAINAAKRELDRFRELCVVTGLPNRLAFEHRLMKESETSSFCLLFFDLVGFKQINDSEGHLTGDQLLAEIGKCLKLIAPHNSAYRWGGDEFAVLLPGPHDESAMHTLHQRIQKAFANDLMLGDRNISIQASFGYAVYPDDSPTTLGMTQAVDLAMYHSKQLKAGELVRYQRAFLDQATQKSQIIEQFRAALSKDQISVYWQPIVGAKHSDLVAVEALLRWQQDDRPMVNSTEYFVDLLESREFGVKAGFLAIEKALQQFAGCTQMVDSEVRLNINISECVIRESDFAARLDDASRRYGISPTRITLEMTEHAAFKLHDQVLASLRTVRERGYKIAIDDFGVGHSSLTRLIELPVDFIKLDKSFVDGLCFNQKRQTVCRSVIDMCNQLGLPVTAEGIENLQNLTWLRAHGVDTLQGYFFTVPLQSLDEVGRRFGRHGATSLPELFSI